MEPDALNLTRRDLLKATSSLALFPRIWRPTETFAFGFFSDSLIGHDDNLNRCAVEFTRMKAETLAFCIHGGNIIANGLPDELAAYQSLVEQQGITTYSAPGPRDAAAKARSFDHGGCHFILLDSTLPYAELGHVSRTQLQWLGQDLARAAKRVPIFVVLHHWVGRDTVIVDNEEALLRMLTPYNVKLILTGHANEDRYWTCEGIGVTSNRSLAAGVWQAIVVDPASQLIGVFRRTPEKPDLELIAKIPLNELTRERPQWASLEERPNRDPGTELRWDSGPWVPMREKLVPDGLVPGFHRVAFRRDAKNYFLGLTVPVRSDRGLKPTWSTLLKAGVIAAPVRADEHILVAHTEGLSSVAILGGLERWRVPTAAVYGRTVVIGDSAFFGTLDGKFRAVRLTDGGRRWDFDAKAPVVSSPVVANGHVIFANTEGKVTSLTLARGEVHWQITVDAPAIGDLSADDARIYLRTGEEVVALDGQTGETIWRTASKTDPILAKGCVYLLSEGNLQCRNAETSELAWQVLTVGDSNPVIANDQIYLANAVGTLVAHNATDGAEVWRTNLGSTIQGSRPAVVGSHLAIGTLGGELVLLDSRTGQKIWGYQLPAGHFLSTPLITDRHVYAANLGEVMFQFSLPAQG